MSDRKKPIEKTGDRILGYLFKNKLYGAITFIVYLLICKVIDMNTIQWFGDDIFIRNGNILEFIISYTFFGSCVVVAIGIIVNAFRGKLF